jgi:Ribbon-helix-helix protein, copG family
VRTTLTLDDDVYHRLESETRRTGRSFKEIVNEHLRRSLAAGRRDTQRPHFRVDAREMGLRPGVDLSSIEQLLDQLDGPVRR